MRELNKRMPDGKLAIEPYCHDCRVDLFTGKSYCDCGWTYEERLASRWRRDGSNPKPRGPEEKPICDCERSANGLGISGRECDCMEERDEAVRHKEPIR